MVRTGLVTTAYVSAAWTLVVSYQLFTEKAVETVLSHITIFLPSVSGWLASRIDTLVFIYAFAWIFLLASAVPSIILGKQRSILVQFFVCLALALIALVFQDMLVGQISSLIELFANPLLAYVYLSMPFLLMLAIDVHSRRRLELSQMKSP
ncbi:MAG TPA: hypothetical protein VMW36_02610 [Patescibacteria group bacterium]|nr:hypothetical protein [Patescibacteria group bacterium]